MRPEAMFIREATAEDSGVLGAAGLEAMNWTGEARFTLEQFMSMPSLSHYIEGWPRSGDFGVIAETAEGAPAGAAWCRLFAADDAGYGFVAPDIPEPLTLINLGHDGLVRSGGLPGSRPRSPGEWWSKGYSVTERRGVPLQRVADSSFGGPSAK